MSGERWAGTGHSTTSSSEQAATEATTAAIAGRENAKLLIVFASERHDLQTLVTAINTTSGGVPLIGCSTAGEIATTGPGDASVVVFAIGGDGFAVTTADQRGIGARLRQAGADLATAMERADRRNHQTLVLLTDALAGDQQEIVRGIYSVFGAFVAGAMFLVMRWNAA
ncbi:MAG TPA: FIST N-terminal domain-containing protein, partial [Miltoncostaeales bacterium]|nr:FIST N-terminal domain-containing protein [Miltoncostaeales bacterium]